MVGWVHDNGGGGGGEEDYRQNQQLGLLKAVKEEDDDEGTGFADDTIDGGGEVNNGSSSSSSSPVVWPKPMEGLHQSGPPPFLRKTFEMVEDPETDPIVSWNFSRNSFVVWDSYRFSEILLPKYFKHKNFSSFVRQLNTYGFRKIDSDRWEFANEGFRGGKKDLLKNIKRRSRYTKQQRQLVCTNNSADGIGLEAEVDLLKKDQNLMQFEVSELRQEQEKSNHRLNVVEERLRFAECKQRQICNFLAKMVRCPDFVRQLVQKRNQRQSELDDIEFGKSSKRRRLLETGVTENYPMLGSEFSRFQPDCIENSNKFISSSSQTESAARDDPNIYVELEDLVNWKACSWTGFPSELVEQTGC